MTTINVPEPTSKPQSNAIAKAVITAALLCPRLTESVIALTTNGDIRRAVSLLDSVSRYVNDLLIAHNYVPSDPCDEECGDDVGANSNAETLFSFTVAVDTASTMLEEFGDLHAAREILEEARHDLAMKALEIPSSLSPIN